MRCHGRSALALLLAVSLAVSPVACAKRVAAPGVTLPPAVFEPLQKDLQKPYLELFETAHRLEYSPRQIQDMRKYLDGAKDYCVAQFKEHGRQHERELGEAQRSLKRDSDKLSDEERQERHCRIQNLRTMKAQVEVLANHAIPVAYENRQAKLELIEKWPAQFRQVEQQIVAGAHRSRTFGDVKDIGFRQVGVGQEDDVRRGLEAIKQMKQAGLIPPEVEEKQVVSYVKELSERIARASDLRVPVNTTVLNSKEINAFALPGGYIYIQRGLLEAAEDEAQLAGVIAHEIAHAAARHGHRLMRRATVAGIIYQAAQLAALVLTGGVAGIGTYYALQYGFYGLGLVLSLDLLGVSREFELEADVLGVQYAWNAGYDTSGFIRFFDKMATREGYVNGASWFRTHPPFYERMVTSQREILFLPKKEGLRITSTEFEEMKKALKKVTEEADKKEEKDRPSLLTGEMEKGCPEPDKIEYEPGKPIEELCRLPSVTHAE